MKERVFYINKPRIIQREGFAKEQNVVQPPFEVKNKNAVIETLGAKLQ